MEGLEIREVNLSELENEATLGAEYYGPTYSVPVDRLNSSIYTKLSLSKICGLITDGDHGSADYADEGVRFILSEAVEEGWIDEFKCRFITPVHAVKLPRSALREGDVLVTKTGVYFGKSAVVPPRFVGANTIAHVGILRVRAGVSVDSHYLSTFLNSSYGQAQLRRRGIKATRPEIKLLEFADIVVPLVTAHLQNRIKEVVLASNAQREQTRRGYEKAISQLTRAAGLDDWQPPESLTYLRNSSEALAAGRLDAEFFSPKTNAIRAMLKAKGDLSLADVCTVGTGYPWRSETFIERGNTEGVPFVRIRDCKPGGIHGDELDRLPANYVLQEGQSAASAGDLVVGMDGLKWFYCSRLLDPCYVNQRVAWLHSFDAGFPSAYLMTVINSFLGQSQLLSQMTIAQTVGHITLDDLRSLRIPVLDQKARRAIADCVEQSLASMDRSSQLLNAAKRAVEIAIEDSEAAALAYLDGVGA